MFFPILFGFILYRVDFSSFYPPVPPGVAICFAGRADDCHYRGELYNGLDPTQYILENPEFDCSPDERDDPGMRTAMLFVRLSSGNYVIILSRKASHIPHRIMRLSACTTFSYDISKPRMVSWTYTVGDTIHLYQASLKNNRDFASLTDAFEQNASDSSEAFDDNRSDELTEEEIGEISRRFRACLQYGTISESTRHTLEQASLAYTQLWAALFIYVGWHALVTVL